MKPEHLILEIKHVIKRLSTESARSLKEVRASIARLRFVIEVLRAKEGDTVRLKAEEIL